MFGIFDNDGRGYTRGSLDVVTAVNLLFKGILLSPIFLLALYITITMMKHMIFQGIPSMNKPTESQQERIKESDSRIGEPVPEREVAPPPVVLPAPTVEDLPVRVNEVSSYLRPTVERNEVMYEYCTRTWLPLYGHTEFLNGSPCKVYVDK